MLVSEVPNKMKNIVRNLLFLDPKFEIEPELSFEDLGADSLDEVEILQALEAEWDIEFTDDEWYNIKTVGQAIECVKAKPNSTARPAQKVLV